MTKGFTKISNQTIIDSNLSFEAMGLYSLLSYYSNIPGFKINKSHIQAAAKGHGMGETKFNRVWKELKDKGFLIQEKKSIRGKFEYIYKLTKTIIDKVVTKVREVVDDQQQKDEEHSELEGVINSKEEVLINGLNHKEIKELIELCGDAKKVKEYVEYSKSKNPFNLFKYTKNAIIKGFKISNSNYPNNKKIAFTDYEQREYDYRKLEWQLLGWE